MSIFFSVHSYNAINGIDISLFSLKQSRILIAFFKVFAVIPFNNNWLSSLLIIDCLFVFLFLIISSIISLNTFIASLLSLSLMDKNLSMNDTVSTTISSTSFLVILLLLNSNKVLKNNGFGC